MPARHEVEIRVTGDNRDALAKLRQLNKGLEDSRNQFQRDFGEIARRARNATIAIGAAVTGAVLVLRELNEELDAFTSSQRKLDAAAKLSSTSLEVLEQIAADTRERFHTSAIQANELTVAISKLTAKAGDVRQTADAIAAFLNVGAAQGLTMEQTLQAVQQAILGLDEGTDKLFQKNPSVLYAEFAARIDRTAASLTDQEKAQALLTAALETSLVVGEKYSEFLADAAGKQAQLNARLSDAKIEFAEAIQPARVRVLEAFVEVVEDLGAQLAANQDGVRAFADDLARIAAAGARIAGFAGKVGAFLARPGVVMDVRSGFEPRVLSAEEVRALEREHGPIPPGGLLDTRTPPVHHGAAAIMLEGLRGLGGAPAVSAPNAPAPPDLAQLESRAKILLSILESQRAAGETTAATAAELHAIYGDVVAVIRAGGDALDENAAKALALRNAIDDAFGELTLRRARQQIEEMADELAAAAAAAGRIRVRAPDFSDRPRAPSLGPGAGLPAIVTPSTRLRELEDEMRVLQQAGLGPEGMDPARLEELTRLTEQQGAAMDRWAERMGAAASETDRMAVSVIGAFGEMATAAIVQGELTASAVIGMLTQIGTAAAAQANNFLLGGILGVAGGLLGAAFARDRTPQPVRIEEYGPRARAQQKEDQPGPENVIVQVVAPVTGEVIQEIEYRLGRRRRLDAVERLPARRE